jgi:hypothetical protein
MHFSGILFLISSIILTISGYCTDPIYPIVPYYDCSQCDSPPPHCTSGPVTVYMGYKNCNPCDVLISVGADNSIVAHGATVNNQTTNFLSGFYARPVFIFTNSGYGVNWTITTQTASGPVTLSAGKNPVGYHPNCSPSPTPGCT